ncbi:unnamed protein product [Adineta steineri]|uniref:Uncharacterized protein n=1 Tax=Adineta steineri TaxID=433720 RepID=A0A814THV0_9BILA|nr:unnamed protein product [Adineta steineri]CAF3990322.1 unnamed protein product [Adineta steineri]
MKGNAPSYQMSLRGIGGNWLVCLAFCLSTSVRDLNSKIIVQMGMLLGANLSIGNYILNVLIPVTLGNILGGGIFVGFIYWYLYLAKKPDNDINISMKILNKDVSLGVKQHDDIIQF